MVSMVSLLKAMVKKGASDMHLRVGAPPMYRISGRLFKAKMEPLRSDDLQEILNSVTDEDMRQRFSKKEELDMGVGFRGIGRFRINAFLQRGTTALAVRAIRTEIPAFDDLNFPQVVLDIANRRRGLVLVTGTTGSGKSTLLASMIDHINSTKPSNIVTVEDPIEFLFKDKKSAIVQREVGSDTTTFAKALRASFRQDPDVIMIGEIRDADTMETALSASDTGHLVMSTLHTMNALETISRIITFFPAHRASQIRMVLSNVLVAIVSLRLIPRKDGGGLIPAAEIMLNNATIAEYISDPSQSHKIVSAIADGYSQYGSQTFDQSLYQLIQDDQISFDTARQYASNPDDFELKVMGGISGTSDRQWMTDSDIGEDTEMGIDTESLDDDFQ